MEPGEYGWLLSASELHIQLSENIWNHRINFKHVKKWSTDKTLNVLDNSVSEKDMVLILFIAKSATVDDRISIGDTGREATMFLFTCYVSDKWFNSHQHH